MKSQPSNVTNQVHIRCYSPYMNVLFNTNYVTVNYLPTYLPVVKRPESTLCCIKFFGFIALLHSARLLVYLLLRFNDFMSRRITPHSLFRGYYLGCLPPM